MTTLSSETFQNLEVQVEVLNFAQSIMGFHQLKTTTPTTMSLLNDHV